MSPLATTSSEAWFNTFLSDTTNFQEILASHFPDTQQRKAVLKELDREIWDDIKQMSQSQIAIAYDEFIAFKNLLEEVEITQDRGKKDELRRSYKQIEKNIFYRGYNFIESKTSQTVDFLKQIEWTIISLYPEETTQQKVLWELRKIISDGKLDQLWNEEIQALFREFLDYQVKKQKWLPIPDISKNPFYKLDRFKQKRVMSKLKSDYSIETLLKMSFTQSEQTEVIRELKTTFWEEFETLFWSDLEQNKEFKDFQAYMQKHMNGSVLFEDESRLTTNKFYIAFHIIVWKALEKILNSKATIINTSLPPKIPWLITDDKNFEQVVLWVIKTLDIGINLPSFFSSLYGILFLLSILWLPQEYIATWTAHILAGVGSVVIWVWSLKHRADAQLHIQEWHWLMKSLRTWTVVTMWAFLISIATFWFGGASTTVKWLIAGQAEQIFGWELRTDRAKLTNLQKFLWLTWKTEDTLWFNIDTMCQNVVIAESTTSRQERAAAYWPVAAGQELICTGTHKWSSLHPGAQTERNKVASVVSRWNISWFAPLWQRETVGSVINRRIDHFLNQEWWKELLDEIMQRYSWLIDFQDWLNDTLAWRYLFYFFAGKQYKLSDIDQISKELEALIPKLVTPDSIDNTKLEILIRDLKQIIDQLQSSFQELDKATPGKQTTTAPIVIQFPDISISAKAVEKARLAVGKYTHDDTLVSTSLRSYPELGNKYASLKYLWINPLLKEHLLLSDIFNSTLTSSDFEKIFIPVQSLEEVGITSENLSNRWINISLIPQKWVSIFELLSKWFTKEQLWKVKILLNSLNTQWFSNENLESHQVGIDYVDINPKLLEASLITGSIAFILLVMAILAELAALLIGWSTGVYQERHQKSKEYLENFEPKLRAKIKTIVDALNMFLERTQLASLFWIPKITDEQFILWLRNFFEDETTITWVVWHTTEYADQLLNPERGTEHTIHYNKIRTSLAKLWTFGWAFWFITKYVIPWGQWIVDIYKKINWIDVLAGKWGIHTQLAWERSIVIVWTLEKKIESLRMKRAAIRVISEKVFNWEIGAILWTEEFDAISKIFYRYGFDLSKQNTKITDNINLFLTIKAILQQEILEAESEESYCVALYRNHFELDSLDAARANKRIDDLTSEQTYYSEISQKVNAYLEGTDENWLAGLSPELMITRHVLGKFIKKMEQNQDPRKIYEHFQLIEKALKSAVEKHFQFADYTTQVTFSQKWLQENSLKSSIWFWITVTPKSDASKIVYQKFIPYTIDLPINIAYESLVIEKWRADNQIEVYEAGNELDRLLKWSKNMSQLVPISGVSDAHIDTVDTIKRHQMYYRVLETISKRPIVWEDDTKINIDELPLAEIGWEKEKIKQLIQRLKAHNLPKGYSLAINFETWDILLSQSRFGRGTNLIETFKSQQFLDKQEDLITKIVELTSKK